MGGALRAATSPLSPISPAQLSAFLQHIAPHIHSILVNYDHLNNYEQRADLDKAVALLRSRIALARKACPKAFLWLRVDDHHAGLENMQKWAKALEGSVDGYCIYRWHEWNVRQEAQHVKAAAPLVKTGKPVLRGGFRYTCPRPRRGLEKDLAKNFRMRMAIYEKWIQERKYTGYTRRIGDGIPGAVNVNMSFLPPGNSMKE